uniref:Uncharacterized protein n=1 Tax=Escherichia coli TaxID=562 RepID=A0A3G1E194_ECOLX|nr:hypothetical protein plasmid_0247 [Escherichia coli]QNL33306.1 hypothetical protein [Escherichia coli]
MSQCLFSRNIYYIKNEIVQKSAKFMNKKGRKFILCGLHCLTPYFSKYV